MKPLERLTHRVIFRSGIIVVAATMVLALSSTSARHVGLDVLAATVIGVSSAPVAAAENNDTAIRPFRVNVPKADLADLRRRLAATRWPDKETVADESQGAQLAKLQELVRYWGTDYDWRKAETKLNAFPQFKTRIDGVDIHFIHVRSPHPNALPLIITHGWPGSVFEQIKLIGPLTDPTKYGGRAEDAFDVVIPSLPGFGFSERPTQAGWGLERIGSAWAILMKRLGYTHYVAQGGDWGAGVVAAMGRQAPVGLLGIHTNFPAVITAEVGAALGGDKSALAALSEKELSAVKDLGAYVGNGGLSYLVMMGARPQAVGYGLTDSPAGLAGWMLVHSGFAKWSYGMDPKQSPTRDDVLDNFSLVLADEHRRVVGADLLGEPRRKPGQCGRSEKRRDQGPGGHHGVPGRGPARPGGLGPSRLPQADVLQRGRSWRPLRHVGIPGAVRDGAARGVQIVALVKRRRRRRA